MIIVVTLLMRVMRFAPTPACRRQGGIIFKEGIKCYNHSGREAEGNCVICEKPLCSGCARIKDKRYFCKEHYKYNVHGFWAQVYEVKSESDALPIKMMLDNHDIPCEILTQRDPRMLTVGLLSVIRIMVPRNLALKAEEVVAKNID